MPPFFLNFLKSTIGIHKPQIFSRFAVHSRNDYQTPQQFIHYTTNFQSTCLKFKDQVFQFKDSVRCMAGHAKWQNVKHIKAARDKEKTTLCNKYVRLLTYAIKEKGPDPKTNIKLVSIMDEAKKNNVPSSTMENILKRSMNRKATKFGTLEILTSSGCLIIAEYETDNISTFRHTVKGHCKKYNANILSGEGRWRAVYQQKGILKADPKINGQPISSEKALDSAIEAGAEEVHQKEDEEDVPYLEFVCDPEDFNAVKKELEIMSFNLEEAYIGYIASTTVQLGQEDERLVDGLLTELSNMQEIIRLYENVQ